MDTEDESDDGQFRSPPLDFDDLIRLKRFEEYQAKFVSHGGNNDKQLLSHAANQSAVPMECESQLKMKMERSLKLANEVLAWTYPYAFLLDNRSDRFKMFMTLQLNLEEKTKCMVQLIPRYDELSLETIKTAVYSLEEETRRIVEFGARTSLP
jgi:hypothetical protein